MEDVNIYACQHHRLMITLQNILVPVPMGTIERRMARSAEVRLFTFQQRQDIQQAIELRHEL